MFPVQLRQQLAINGLRIDDSTVRNGNCGIHAFVIGVLAAAHEETALRPFVARWRLPLDELLLKVRAETVAWMRENHMMEMWEGMSLCQLCLVMSGEFCFYTYLEKRSRNGDWIDLPFLHALGNLCGVDVSVFQDGMEPVLAGPTLNGNVALWSKYNMEPSRICTGCWFSSLLWLASPDGFRNLHGTHGIWK